MDVLQYHARRMHLMAWQLQLAEQQRAAARLQREYLTAYYSSPDGAVPWQQDMI